MLNGTKLILNFDVFLYKAQVAENLKYKVEAL